MKAQIATSSKSEKDWQAESDAHTLAEAEAIKADKKRYESAVKAAKKMEDEKQAEADAMSKIAAGKADKMSVADYIKYRNKMKK